MIMIDNIWLTKNCVLKYWNKISKRWIFFTSSKMTCQNYKVMAKKQEIYTDVIFGIIFGEYNVFKSGFGIIFGLLPKGHVY